MSEPWECLPDPWRQQIASLPTAVKTVMEEIRFRVGRPPYLYGAFGCQPLDAEPSTPNSLETLLLRLADHSLYARLDEIRQGYLTLPGGHRVGLSGRAVMDQHRVDTIRDISGLSIRRARAVEGWANEVINRLDTADPVSILVASPPRAGKTTLIRDLARFWADAERITVIVDERSEIAGCDRGVPTYRLGKHSDVLDGWPKAQGMVAALRSLSPEVLVVDELATAEDFEAAAKVRWSGVKVIASMHLGDSGAIDQHQGMDSLWHSGVFDAMVLLSRRHGPGTIESIIRWNPRASLATAVRP